MTDDSIVTALSEAFETQIAQATEYYREELSQVNAQLAALQAEDVGWFGMRTEDDQGLTLEQLKGWSKKLRESVAGSPLPKQANALRFSYTFSAPFIIPGLEGSVEPPAKRGRKPADPPLDKFYHDSVNQRYVFGKEAQETISTSCSTDGCYLALGDDRTRTLRSVPISQITGTMTNPDFPDEVWAYLREWDRGDGKEPAKKWYYTDKFEGVRQSSIPVSPEPGSERVAVDKEKTMIDFVVNAQSGWTYGVPDLMAADRWNRKYITMMNHGEEVSAAMAFFALQVKKKRKDGASDIGIQMGNTKKAGNLAVMGEGNEFGAITSAKSAYDFEGLRPIAAMYASATGVSVVDLLASPAAAGSSYGSAQALAPGMRRGIEARRLQIAAWMERVIYWGTKKRIQITPASVEETDPYRRAQIVVMAWNSGLVHASEARPEIMHLSGITPVEQEAPDGVLLPNNEDSLPRQDVDIDSYKVKSAPAPDQGQSNGSGGGGSTTANDLRDDTIS